MSALRRIGCALAITLGGLAETRADEAPRFSVEDMKADVHLLRDALDELHPSLHWYTPEAELTRAFDGAVEKIRAPMTEGDLRAILQPAVTLIRCGHTSLSTSAAYDEWLDRRPAALLPFRLWVQGDLLYVLATWSSDTRIEPGDQLQTINGLPVREILARARALVAADGYNQTMKDVQLNFGGGTFVKEFVFHTLGLQPPYALAVLRPGGVPFTTTVTRRPPAPDAGPSRSRPPRPAPPSPPPSRSFEILSSGVARLNIRGFDDPGAPAFHRQVFSEMAQKKVRHLVLDLRENGGGNGDDAEDLMKYLMDRPFTMMGNQWAKVRHPERPTFARHLDPKMKKLLLDNNRYRRTHAGRHHFDYAQPAQLVPHREHRYGGAVYLLVGGRTFSSAALFAASLAAQREVTVIGQETGGGQAGCSGGINHRMTLPRTGLRIRLPVFRIHSASGAPNRGRGLMPHHEVRPRWQDIVAGTDLEMQKALELIAARS